MASARFRIEKRLPMKTAHPTWHLNRSGRGLRPTEIGDAFYLCADSWLTFRQGLSLGGHVRRGECGTTATPTVLCGEKRRGAETGEEAQARSSNAFPR